MYARAMAERTILHVDMDAFYASVEQRDHPDLRGCPVVVGGLGGRGVVAAASYEARAFGVRSAMPVREALKRCPGAICVKPRMSLYRAVSSEVFSIFGRFTPVVQGLSLDEAFLDVTASQAALGEAEKIAVEIKRQIKECTGLTASVGVAPNKLVAKIASELRKPDGLVIVGSADVTALLDPLPISKLFGLGEKTAARVEKLGIRTLGELRQTPAARLRPVFGRYAEQMRRRAAGIDERPVSPSVDERQISAEETFESDIADHERLVSELIRLADRTCSRLRGQDLFAGCVTIKVRRADFATYTRQRRFEPPTQETRVISRLARQLLQEWLRTQPNAALRLLGVGVSELQGRAQPDLFESADTAGNRNLDDAVDRIRDKYGASSLTRGSALPRSGD